MSDPGTTSNMPPDPDVNPLLRHTLRFCLSSKEYKFLHDQAVKRAPAAVQEKAPSPTRFEAIVRSKNRYNEAAVRASLRVFVGSGALLKLVDVVMSRMKGAGAGAG